MSTAQVPPPKKAPPPPPPKANGAPPPQRSRKKAEVLSGIVASSPKRIVLYGRGGIGKSELASLLKDVGIKPLMIDLEGGSDHIDISRIKDVTTYQECRDHLQDEELFSGYGAVVVDTLTKLEELCGPHVVATVPKEKGGMARYLSDYGWGKELGHIYDAFMLVLNDLDAHIRRGRHVIGICHDCTSNVPNPFGEDWLQYQPRLQSPASGKNSIRLRVREWADYLLFIDYDTSVSEGGKAVGAGTRTIYPKELPTHMAKSRGILENPIVFERGSSQVWQELLKGEK